MLSQIAVVGEGVVTSHAYNALQLLDWGWELRGVGMLKGRLCEAGLLKLCMGNRFRWQRLLKTQQQGLGSLWLKTFIEVVVRMHVDL